MKTISVQQPINLKVVRFELDFTALNSNPKPLKPKQIKIPNIKQSKKPKQVPPPPVIDNYQQKRKVTDLIEELLDELYANQRDWSNSAVDYSYGSTSVASLASSQYNCAEQTDSIERSYLESLELDELRGQANDWEQRLQMAGERLARCVRTRDRLRRQQKKLCAAFTIMLRHIS